MNYEVALRFIGIVFGGYLGRCKWSNYITIPSKCAFIQICLMKYRRLYRKLSVSQWKKNLLSYVTNRVIKKSERVGLEKFYHKTYMSSRKCLSQPAHARIYVPVASRWHSFLISHESSHRVNNKIRKNIFLYVLYWQNNLGYSGIISFRIRLHILIKLEIFSL